MIVSTVTGPTYGKTTFNENINGSTRVIVGTTLDATKTCLNALAGDTLNAD
jgi:hypothetical protein